jgi:hypothetical protein
LADALLVDRMDDSHLGDDCGDKFRGGNIESRVVDLDIHRCGSFSERGGDLL